MIKKILPVLPLRDIVVFPYMVAPLFVGRKQSVNALNKAMTEDKKIFLLAQKNSDVDNPNETNLYKYGTIAKVLQLLKLPDGTIKVLVEGIERAKVINLSNSKEVISANISSVDISYKSNLNVKALLKIVVEQFESYHKINKKIPIDIVNNLKTYSDGNRIADVITVNLNISLYQKQEILEIISLEERLDKISANQQFLREEQLLEEERLDHTNSRQKIIRDEQEERKRIMMERTVEEEELDEEYRGIVDEEEYTQERDMYLRDEAEEEVKFREEHIQEEERYRLSEEDEFMHPEAKQEMKDRLRYQVNCGTFIDPKYKSRIDACGTKANLKLKKPFNKKLQDVMNSRAGDMPKSIRQVYDELATDEINRDADTVCQHVQKGVSMKSCSNKYNMIGEEDESITDTLRANDSCFDPYSQY